MKVCGKCGVPKDENQFHKNKHNADGLHSRCKECRKLESSNYIQNNKEKISDKKSQHYQSNKKTYSEKNRRYYRNNKDVLVPKIREYRQSHKVERNTHLGMRYITDPDFKIRRLLSSNIYKVLKNGFGKGGASILQFLPYSIQELKQHLQSQFEFWMTWNNWGNFDPKAWNDNDSSTWTWQIDHIIPHSTFKYSSMNDEGFQKCWSLNNLRPLSSKQNILDGSNRTRHGEDNE